MRRPAVLAVGLFALLLLAGLLGVVAPTRAEGGPAATASYPPLTGAVHGPTDLAVGTNGTYTINATGGPAEVNGKLLGSIVWSVTVSAVDLNGISVTPPNGTIKTATSVGRTTLKTGQVAETVTLSVQLTSTLGTQKATTNLTYTVNLRVPYVVQAKLIAGSAGVLPFKVVVTLDGSDVGNVSVPALNPLQSYSVTFRYPAFTLAPGHHTFELSVADEHGLVLFSGGRTTVSTTFYVAPPTPNNSVWYIAGVVAFFGALFIFATRVAARRRGSGRR